jgi:hypothetical protein
MIETFQGIPQPSSVFIFDYNQLAGVITYYYLLCRYCSNNTIILVVVLPPVVLQLFNLRARAR